MPTCRPVWHKVITVSKPPPSSHSSSIARDPMPCFSNYINWICCKNLIMIDYHQCFLYLCFNTIYIVTNSAQIRPTWSLLILPPQLSASAYTGVYSAAPNLRPGIIRSHANWQRSIHFYLHSAKRQSAGCRVVWSSGQQLYATDININIKTSSSSSRRPRLHNSRSVSTTPVTRTCWQFHVSVSVSAHTCHSWPSTRPYLPVSIVSMPFSC